MPPSPDHPTTLKTPSDWVRLLDQQLNPRLARRIHVTYGRARTTPIHVKWPPGRAEIRMHEMFASAPEDVALAVGQWLQSGRRARRACALLDAWIQRALGELPPTKPRQVRLQPTGEVHDLETIAAGLFEREFEEEFGRPSSTRELRPGITFGRRTLSRSRHSLQLGSYSPEKNVVRIHPVLDQAAVPEWFVRFVLFHEFLHAALEGPLVRQNGERAPRVMHGPAFRTRERSYERYDEAIAWEKQWISGLIRSARTGQELASGARKKKPRAASQQVTQAPKESKEPKESAGWVQRILFGRSD